jgi:hypothetical protein
MGGARHSARRPTLTVDPKLRQTILDTEQLLKDGELTSQVLTGDVLPSNFITTATLSFLNVWTGGSNHCLLRLEWFARSDVQQGNSPLLPTMSAMRWSSTNRMNSRHTCLGLKFDLRLPATSQHVWTSDPKPEPLRLAIVEGLSVSDNRLGSVPAAKMLRRVRNCSSSGRKSYRLFLLTEDAEGRA